MDPSPDASTPRERRLTILMVYGGILAIIAIACLIALTMKCRPRGRVNTLPKIEGSVPIPPSLPDGSWRFIVSGDSRNCGDVVMPAIAAHSAQFAPSFYWHLGDLRAIYKIDEDMAFAAAKRGQVLTCDNYERLAWPDFITNQIAPFGHVPFYLGIGNHEVIPPKDEPAFKGQFADWLDLPVLKLQRDKDGEKTNEAKAICRKDKDNKPVPHPESYYHWIQGGVDFIYLDNAYGCFSDDQLTWLKKHLDKAKNDSEIMSVVVGMHEALPDSLANDHSMGDTGNAPDGTISGRKAYKALVDFREQSRNPDGSTKQVYVLASHSHFYMEDIFDTDAIKKINPRPLPGWIIGTAGAVRYALPQKRPKIAQTDVYGYLLATVSPNGTIEFSFKEVHESDIPAVVRQLYPEALIPWCFGRNSQNKEPKAADITAQCPVPQSKTTAATGNSH